MPTVGVRPIRVLTVDFSPIVQQGIQRTLDDPEFEIVGMLDTSRDILHAVHKLAPAVVMTELLSRETSAIDVLAQLGEMEVPPAVLVLTRYENDTNILETVKAGARGFLLEHRTSAPLLREAIKALADGAFLVESEHLEKTFQALDGGPAAPEDGNVVLTKVEASVLRLLALGYTNAAIAAQTHISIDTAKRYVSDVIRKMGARSRVHAALLGAQAGIVGLIERTDGHVDGHSDDGHIPTVAP